MIKKRFPAKTDLEETTFLNNKKINAELYALLLSYSEIDENNRTIVKKSSLPIQKTLCEKLGINSPKTYRSHLSYLIETKYIEEIDGIYYFPNTEDVFLMIPLKTIKFLNDTLKD